ncbi:hypothetical protein VNI00_017297 [Paramarasmius palmivorus]|uniref:Uncharacterized protein n=1 Tax=Paramarasmius palmivorus TaxID=297713 RepID=A0AAW0B6M8_9AGAR
MIIRPGIIAFLSSLALLAVANPVFDFIASSLSHMAIPSTGTVNIPASAKWRIPGFLRGSFDEFQIVFVQENPVITSSVIQTNFTPGQTEGVITFTATTAGVYHLEVSGFGASAQLGENIIITEPSTTQTSTSPPGPTSTSSEATPVMTGMPTPKQPTSLLGAILGTILGLIVIIAAISLYLWFRRSSNRASASGTLDKESTALRPWLRSSQYSFGDRSHTTSYFKSEEDEPHTSTLGPSDSVSQVWAKEKVFEKRRPLRESTDLTIIMEKHGSDQGK